MSELGTEKKQNEGPRTPPPERKHSERFRGFLLQQSEVATPAALESLPQPLAPVHPRPRSVPFLTQPARPVSQPPSTALASLWIHARLPHFSLILARLPCRSSSPSCCCQCTPWSAPQAVSLGSFPRQTGILGTSFPSSSCTSPHPCFFTPACKICLRLSHDHGVPTVTMALPSQLSSASPESGMCLSWTSFPPLRYSPFLQALAGHPQTHAHTHGTGRPSQTSWGRVPSRP